jgi:hypothetical protein
MRTLKPVRTVVALAAVFIATAWAAEAPLQLQNNVQGNSSAAYYGLPVPLWLREQAASAELSDLRVLNARGDELPYAWHVSGLQNTAQQRRSQVPFFKTPQAKQKDSGGQTSTTPSGWIIDARAIKGTLLELQLGLEPSAQGVFRFSIESSADLQKWDAVRSEAQLVALRRNGELLEKNTFDIAGVQAKYLRIQPLEGSGTPALAQVNVSSMEHYVKEPALQWSAWLAPAHCEPKYCDYIVSPRIPIEKLEWQLAEPNTLATVELLAQYEPVAAVDKPESSARRHPLREHLHGLRHKTRPSTPGGAQPWYSLRRTSVYWLQLPEGDVRSEPTILAQGLYARIRVQVNAGIKQLGAVPPKIRTATQPVSLVFLARQPAPYRLAWGGAASDAALPIQQLMPTLAAGQLPPLDTATVLAPDPVLDPAAAMAAPPPKAADAPVAPSPSRKYWLWGVLLAALVAMGAMAWSLLRPKSSTP